MSLLNLHRVPGTSLAGTTTSSVVPAMRNTRITPVVLLVLIFLVSCGLSIWIGAGHLTGDLVWISRLPRTLAIILSGAAMALGGLLMQLLVRNKFVEPATVGTTESAGAGLLAATVIAPAMPVAGKMGIAVAAALLGTVVFLQVLRAVPPQTSIVTVPLVGIMLSGVIAAATTFIAHRLDLLQTMTMWMTGDFSGVIRGRFELLWLVGILLVVSYLFADRFTLAGLGAEHATGLGLPYRTVMAIGLTIVAISSAACVVVVGALPFLGLVVPNVVSLLMGDHLRRSLPVVCLGGATFVLVCDVLARVVNHPFEIPVGVVVGLVGSAGFIVLLLHRPGVRR